MKQWLKISIKCEPQLVDATTDFLVGVMDAGVEVGVEDHLPTSIVNGYLDYHGSSKRVDERINQLENHLKLLADIFKTKTPSLSTELIQDQDWSSSWKEHFKPFAIVPSLVIAPTWEEYIAKGEEKVIVMDPGMAFGTGHHPTTTLSTSLLMRVVKDNDVLTVLDVGTGTGVLGMAALLFGAGQVLAIDNDPEAVTVAKKNVSANGLQDNMQVALTDLADIKTPFQLVVANIIHDVLLAMADELFRLTEEHGYLILSGIIHGEQSNNIIASFEKIGMTLVVSEISEEWAGLLFQKIP